MKWHQLRGRRHPRDRRERAVDPVATQIAFLAAGGSFGPRDLVYIQGGGKHYFAFRRRQHQYRDLTTAPRSSRAGLGASEPPVRPDRHARGSDRRRRRAPCSTGPMPRHWRRQASARAVFRYRPGCSANSSPAHDLWLHQLSPASPAPSLVAPACTRATALSPDASETRISRRTASTPAGITQRIRGQALAGLVQAPDQIAEGSVMRRRRCSADSATCSDLGGNCFFARRTRGVGVQQRRLSLLLSGTSGPARRHHRARPQRHLAPTSRSAVHRVGLAGGYSDGSGTSRPAPAATSPAPGRSAATRAVTSASTAACGLGPMARSITATFGAPSARPGDQIARGETDGTYVARRSLPRST